MTTTQPLAANDHRLMRIRACREIAESALRRTRRRDSAAILVGLGATTGATLLAGVPAVTTQFLLDGWQLTCGVTAVLTAVATVTSGLRQQFGSTDRLMKSATLASRLRGLEYGLVSGRVAPADADAEFMALLQEYPELPQPTGPVSTGVVAA